MTGEALTIDLSEFVNYLYVILLELAVSPDLEDIPSIPGSGRPAGNETPSKSQSKSLADLLFRTLSLVFHPRTSSSNTPPWTMAAFAKRLLLSSLSWPPNTVLRSLELVRSLMVKEPRLEAFLNTEDRTANGVYRAELDDPQLSNPFGTSFWELRMLQKYHWDDKVRKEASALANFSGD